MLRPLFHQVFLPLVEVPSHAKRQKIRMMEFLDEIRIRDKKGVASKAAAVLVEQSTNSSAQDRYMIHTYFIARLRNLSTVLSGADSWGI